MINRRELLKRSAQAGCGILASATGWNTMRQGRAWAADDATLPRLQVCLVSGSREYKSNETLCHSDGVINRLRSRHATAVS